MNEPGSPLRYPGGKASLTELLADIIRENNLHDGVYVEPFAGGAGAGIELLRREVVSHLIINDLDFPIYAFWTAALRQPDRFIERIMSARVNIGEWERARKIYKKCDRRQVFDVGFSTFFLNRCNRSGIIMGGGPIGGHNQRGNYKLDARFNRRGLRGRIEFLRKYADCITLTNMDAVRLLTRPLKLMEGAFVYLDPPYVTKGPELYLRRFDEAHHRQLSSLLHRPTRFRWVLTYDNSPLIRSMYRDFSRCALSVGYSAASRARGFEWMIFDRELSVPSALVDRHRQGRKVWIRRYLRPRT